ncbi:pyruvate carboxylase [Emiliania huxleyi CCMP1516]|uniref:Pyruvate carboxylase n=3 Tax=Emiliania huxleyi TaxID=2903 RepID=A0A0D3IEI1_EMIH1|nr:pyruvate carboxylase [Emiliania huxleyi CCMP1516]EOD09666.1 pyruvate carboxylase [Emiliania huxleyi CCMP1516]|eukprot:XP_005762095.1 pyruvate carboxylase [Emiliania huxleyi CCMP1516]
MLRSFRSCGARIAPPPLTRHWAVAPPLTRRWASTGAMATPPPARPGWRPIKKVSMVRTSGGALLLCKREPSPERPAHSRAAQASAWQPQCAAPSPAQMDIKTVAIYSKEDFNSVHRTKADEAFLVGQDKSPVGAYLSAEEIENNVDAIHPGARQDQAPARNTRFVELCEQAGITFIGPPSQVIQRFGDKTEARQLAEEFGVPVVPGTQHSVETVEEARDFCQSIGYPVICKAAFGGGGRGMRIVRSEDELETNFLSASREATTAFGNGAMFIERYVESPRHVEIQIIADGTNATHLFERDCSVQRRHQKIVEVAPSIGLPESLRESLYADAIRITKGAGYFCAGTVEFLVDRKTIQVEHTVTEVITGVDLVQIAAGQKLHEIGLSQEDVAMRGFAIQARVTTEDPAEDFRPDTARLSAIAAATPSCSGRIQVWRPAEGFGIRLDGGNAYPGARVLAHYDSMLMKTNIPFILNVLKHPDFVSGHATTSFIGDNPQLLDFTDARDRGQKQYLESSSPRVLTEEGPEGFAKAVRQSQGLLLTDTTWRDAHQSLLATRVRTRDILAIAPLTSHVLGKCYSLENWGGATFDVCLRFLRECPWERLQQMREDVPNVPFQMLLRGANGVGYTNYPDNAVFKFCDVAVKNGMDVFRVFDSLNYMDNLKLGVDAVGAAGGVVEAAISYTGDISDPSKAKYTLDYYLDLARQLVECHIHVLCIKDMAGLLKPAAATTLISALRKEFPNLPIHVHTHDTAGTGVASMLACSAAGADAVDCAVDSMSGMTSQPSMGSLVAALQNGERDTGVELQELSKLIEYWETVRFSYAAFESGQKSGSSEVYDHEMPGGQYTNLQFQSTSLGLADQWSQVKRNYAAANRLLGDIVKVTPSSKVVGDLAQFMAANGLDEEGVRAQAETLSFPSSVVEYFQGAIGIPHGGFPQPMQAQVVKELPVFAGRPGAELPPLDLDASMAALKAKYGDSTSETDLMQTTPRVFEQFKADVHHFGDVSKLPTRAYIEPLELGEEISVELERGKTIGISLEAIGMLNEKDATREATKVQRPKADGGDVNSVGAPMPGVVVETKVALGENVAAGTPMLILSAMKMETVVAAPVAGRVAQLTVASGDDVQAGDLLVELQ